MHDEKIAPIALSELRGDSFLARSRRYFQAILELPLDEDDARYVRLTDLSRIRNALAHANGLREGMSKEDWAKLTATLSRRKVVLDTHRGQVVLPRKYVESAYQDVDSSLRSLIARARLHQDAR
jgi:hypothetical protein